MHATVSMLPFTGGGLFTSLSSCSGPRSMQPGWGAVGGGRGLLQSQPPKALRAALRLLTTR